MGRRVHLASGDPLQRLDAVFASPGIEVLACGVPPLPVAELLAATDHLPVVAVLRVPAGATA